MPQSQRSSSSTRPSRTPAVSRSIVWRTANSVAMQKATSAAINTKDRTIVHRSLSRRNQ